MKELKFTEKNLERHLAINTEPYYSRHIIFTTRDEAKGVAGDIFKIETPNGERYYVLEYAIQYGPYDNVIRIVADSNYRNEGFKTPLQMRNELRRLYGKDVKQLYVHVLKSVNL